MRGTVLAGRYRLDERVGSGRLGDVWRCAVIEARPASAVIEAGPASAIVEARPASAVMEARPASAVIDSPGRSYAVKLLPVSWLDKPDYLARLRHDWARVMTLIDHPAVVRIHGVDVHPDLGPFVIMDYLPGEPLTRVLARVDRFSPADTMDLVAQLADALQALHDLWVPHRGLWPGRVLVRPDGTVALSAFGLERVPGTTSMFDMMTVDQVGYLAPEVVMGEAASRGSDIFSVGVIAYRCLAGRPPFDGDNPLKVALDIVRETPPPLPADLPEPVRSIVERCLAKRDSDRWPTATMLATAARAARWS